MRKPALYRVLLPALVIASMVLKYPPAQAQSAIDLTGVHAEVRFGEQITFTATIRTPVPIQAVSIIITDDSQGFHAEQPIALQADGRVEFQLNTRQNLLRAFTNVSWQYRFTFGDGSTALSESFSIRYADNRFAWQSVESDPVHVYWYQGDASFGQAALEAAQEGLSSMGPWMPASVTAPVEIYIYANVEDLRGTLAPGGEAWVAGHADPALGVVMLVLEPGPEQETVMAQRIPHELMHVLLYRRIGEGYSRVPAWLREGMSALVELQPNADYERTLLEAGANGRLIPLGELCVVFPADTQRAFLAYAQSRSFTMYLHEAYGPAGLLALLSAYAGGAACEHGPEAALGSSLSRLESEWLTSTLKQEPFLPAIRGIAPYLTLLCLVLLIPFVGILIALRRKGDLHGRETDVRS